ncbi:MAG TPA: ISNCY family transposase [Bryobacteraceae bacterium]
MAETEEVLKMGQRERDRLKVLHEVERGQLRQREAAGQLRMSERGFRKLLKRFRERGDGGVMHGLRGRVSARRMPAGTVRRVVKLVSREYADFGPTLASEYLEREHGVKLSRESLRQLLIRAGSWKARPRKLKQVHVWRPRRSCRGELLQWDTSIHAWLEERGAAKMYLIAGIDDATNELFARFVESDSSEQHMRVLWAYVERHGRPQAIYTDKAGLFQPVLAPGWKTEAPGAKSETQLGRAFRELGMEWIAAHSPQAKGRVERCFGTLQNRLVKALRKARIRTLDDANQFLEHSFLPQWQEKFTVPAASSVDAHRSLGAVQLASVLSFAASRRVANDYTIAWEGRRLQIPREQARVGMRGASIRVEQRLDGSMMAWAGPVSFALQPCEPSSAPVQEKAPRRRRHFVPPPGQSRWMQAFRIRRNPPAAEPSLPDSTHLRSPSGLPPSG